MKDKIEIGDIVTLTNDKEYTVTRTLEHDGVFYYLFVDISELSNSKVLYIDGEYLVEVEDLDLLGKITLLMTKEVMSNLKDLENNE